MHEIHVPYGTPNQRRRPVGAVAPWNATEFHRHPNPSNRPLRHEHDDDDDPQRLVDEVARFDRAELLEVVVVVFGMLGWWRADRKSVV